MLDKALRMVEELYVKDDGGFGLLNKLKIRPPGVCGPTMTGTYWIPLYDNVHPSQWPQLDIPVNHRISSQSSLR